LALNTLSELLKITLAFFSFFLTQSGPELVPETRNADTPKQFLILSLQIFFASLLFYCFFRVLANLSVIRFIVVLFVNFNNFLIFKQSVIKCPLGKFIFSYKRVIERKRIMKKKSKKKQPRPQQPSVRLSQCMIVKNEEKNIERALGWAKGIAFEQIVVDTGSTDRTVEIAEKLGAKVFHFEWINDFSAAKNFAIEQASGNWIAFLDADEYFSPKDAAKLLPFFKHIQSDPKLRNTWLVIQCPLLHIDETGKTTSIVAHERLFRNLPSIRYVGKIHEKLNIHVDNTVYGEDIAIIHTGYSRTAYRETNKAQRNIDILKAAISDDPGDINLRGYLAEALTVKAEMDGSIESVLPEIDDLFKEVINTDSKVLSQMRKGAYIHFIKQYVIDSTKYEECEEMCGKALEIFPDDSDILYYLGTNFNNKGDHHAALEALKRCENRLSDKEAPELSKMSTADPTLLQKQIEIAKKGLI